MGKLWTTQETEPFQTAWRKAMVLRVTDGDTIHLRIDLGFDVDGVKAPVRLLSENALLTRRANLKDLRGGLLRCGPP